MASQDTDLTELKMSSLYSQEEIIANTTANTTTHTTNNVDTPSHTNGASSIGHTNGSTNVNAPDPDLSKSRTMMTMSSFVSTEYDPFRSQDCLVKNTTTLKNHSDRRLSLCCLNYIVDFVRALLISDFDSTQCQKVDGGPNPMPTADMTGYIGPRLMANFRGEGRVTTGCLWHACRAVTIGIALIITGISLTIIGYLTDQKEYQAIILHRLKEKFILGVKYAVF